MSTFRLRHFSNPHTLQAIQARPLMELLGPHREYFKARQVDFGRFNGKGPDHEAIARVLMAPDESTPRGLIDDLYYVDDMATAEGMDALLDAVREAGYHLDGADTATPAEVAVQVRLRWPSLIEQKHAEHALVHRRRTFEYFQSRSTGDAAYRQPSSSRVHAFEAHVATQLEALKRGRVCKLYVFERADGVWFLVRRGEPFKREAAIEKAGSASVYYRPERYDVLKYDERLGELSINADGNKKLIALYREAIGELLFGDKDHFPGAAKYNLQPLFELGEQCLVCSDVEGIDFVTLREVTILWGGPEGEVEVRRAKDLFAAYRASGRTLPRGRVVRASFSVKFTGVKVPRTVTLRPSNIASYTHDDDSVVVEEWLRLRGFLGLSTKTSEVRRAAVVAAVAHA